MFMLFYFILVHVTEKLHTAQYKHCKLYTGQVILHIEHYIALQCIALKWPAASVHTKQTALIWFIWKTKYLGGHTDANFQHSEAVSVGDRNIVYHPSHAGDDGGGNWEYTTRSWKIWYVMITKTFSYCYCKLFLSFCLCPFACNRQHLDHCTQKASKYWALI